MTTSDVEDPEFTRPVETLTEVPEAAIQQEPELAADKPEAVAVEPGAANEVLYVPLAVSVGDGFKFGCGFFMAFMVAMLVGFVLLSALFALTSVLGISPLLSP